MSEREYDVVLWGATGFTGALTAEHIVRTHGLDGLRLALAGRDRSKLEAVRERLASIDPRASWLPLLIGDSHDRASLDAIARATKVVCTTVGPYAKYGEPLVAACAAAGTHACDLTGEPQFVARMIARHHASASQSGARIVECCGFDSIPSDLGVLLLHRAYAQRGGQLRGVRAVFTKLRGAASGGTIASMLEIANELAGDPSLRALLDDPYALVPSGEPRGPNQPTEHAHAERDVALGKWTAPFGMAVINAKVVHRSNALLGFPYGRDFTYDERVSTGAGVRGAIAARVTAGVLAAWPRFSRKWTSPVRDVVARLLPQPGEGPDREARERGFFELQLFGEGEGADGGILQLRARVVGHSDPGYGETAKMLGESALCLAFDELDSAAGVSTPAAAMGDALLSRLRAVGMTFTVE
jgi:short subunit dehydrogenase-like uncharacterized protein